MRNGRGKRGGTCRCYICGMKKADSNHARSSYIRVRLGRDEDGMYYGAKGKKHSRKVRRVREKREWQRTE